MENIDATSMLSMAPLTSNLGWITLWSFLVHAKWNYMQLLLGGKKKSFSVFNATACCLEHTIYIVSFVYTVGREAAVRPLRQYWLSREQQESHSSRPQKQELYCTRASKLSGCPTWYSIKGQLESGEQYLVGKAALTYYGEEQRKLGSQSIAVAHCRDWHVRAD